MKTTMLASTDKPMIVHYVSRDKFTTGYINFMKTVMIEYDHYFITASKGFVLNPIEDVRIVYTVHNRDLCFSKEIRNLLEKSRMFIMSGCGSAYLAAFLPQNILDKTFFHFWGGGKRYVVTLTFCFCHSTDIKQSRFGYSCCGSAADRCRWACAYSLETEVAA